MVPPKRSSFITEFRQRGLLGLLISLGCLGGAVFLLSPSGGFPRALIQWDSQHYLDIARRGYQLPEAWIRQAREHGVKASSFATPQSVHQREANLGFFPAYPMIVRAVSSMIDTAVGEERKDPGSDPRRGGSKASDPQFSRLEAVALAVSWLSFLGACLYWTRFSAPRSELRGGLRARDFGILFLQPVTFFLLAGYTESLFLLAILGFFLSLEQLRGESRDSGGVVRSSLRQAGTFFVTCVFGILLTGTRLFGLACVAAACVELLDHGLRQRPQRGSRQAPEARIKIWLGLTACLVSASGAVGFFIYCWFQFGEWDLYFRLQEVGWKNYADFFFFLKPWTYLPAWFFEDTWVSVSKMAVPVAAVLSVVLARRLRRKDLGLQLAAGLMTYLVAAGKARENMDSVIRYLLPVWWIQWGLILRNKQIIFKKATKECPEERPMLMRVALAVGVVLLLAFQGFFAYRFLRGRWIA